MIWYLVSTLTMGLVAVLIYIYYHFKGQFEDTEDIKYQIFRNDEEE